MRIDISLSTNFCAFSSARESLARTTWHLCTVRSLVSFLFFSIPCIVFPKGKERRFGEGLLGENYNRIAAGGLGGLSPRSALQHLLRLRRRSGFCLLQGSKQASNLYFKNFKSWKVLSDRTWTKRYLITPQTLRTVKHPDTPPDFPLSLPLSFSSSYYLSFSKK